MAKRKLSAEKRAELRADLKKATGGGKKTADVLRESAKKYGITTITARWYLNSLNGKKPKRRTGRPAGRRGPGRPPGFKGGVASFVKAVHARAENAKQASRLISRWQILVDNESNLRRQALKLERKLEATSSKAGQLRDRIAELVGR